MPQHHDPHPDDTPVSSGFRFAAELIAWIGAAWLAAETSALLAVLAVVVLIGLPTVFTTPGDKRHTVIATPGPLRILVDLLHYAVAAIVPWMIWPGWLAAACVGCVCASVVLGIPRLRWLLAGAPPTNP